MARLRRSPVAIVAIGYLIVASIIAAQLGTWTDEEYTLATTAHGPAYAFGRAISYELQAPLYFVFESIWREANGSVFWARLPSVLCTFGLFFTFERIGRRLAPSANPTWFAVFATLNPYVVYAGFEIRLYALALLLATAMWLFFDAGFVSGSRRRARIAFVCTTIIAVYVQYFLAFMLVGFACVLLIRGRRRTYARFAIAGCAVSLAALPLAFVAHGQVAGYATHVGFESYLLRHSTLHPWIDFLFPYDRDWDVRRYVHPIYDAFAAIALVATIFARPRLSRVDIAWIAGAAAIQVVYLATIVAVRIPLEDRHYVALYVPLAAAYYVLARGVLASERPRYVAGVGLSIALTVAVVFTQYRYLAMPGDWRRVGGYLSANVRPGDVVVVFAADAVPPLLRAYRGPAPVVPFPAPPPTDAYSADLLTLHSESEAARALASLTRYRHVWLVDDIRCRPDERSYGCQYVEAAVTHAFSVMRSRSFYENRVEELSAIGAGRTPQETSNR